MTSNTFNDLCRDKQFIKEQKIRKQNRAEFTLKSIRILSRMFDSKFATCHMKICFLHLKQ